MLSSQITEGTSTVDNCITYIVSPSTLVLVDRHRLFELEEIERKYKLLLESIDELHRVIHSIR